MLAKKNSASGLLLTASCFLVGCVASGRDTPRTSPNETWPSAARNSPKPTQYRSESPEYGEAGFHVVPEAEVRLNEWSFFFKHHNELHMQRLWGEAPESFWPPNREYYLSKLRQAGVLKRGLTKEEVKRWLGERNETFGTPDLWIYGCGYSNLQVHFENGTVRKYVTTYDEGSRLETPDVW